jgi:hypothetical protein
MPHPIAQNSHKDEDEQWGFDDERRRADCSRILALLFLGLGTRYNQEEQELLGGHRASLHDVGPTQP